MLKLLEAANLSPEELAQTVGVSGMTIRRWLKKPRDTVPRVYVPAIREACYTLIASGRLAADSPVLAALLPQTPSGEYQAALQNLGITEGFDTSHAMSQDDMLAGLLQIGTQRTKQGEVERSGEKILSFRKLGDEWARRVALLWEVVRSSKISRVEKTVAYGALFYLLTPIDFIPDHIPFFGLLDDFGVLGIALAYYKNRFSDLL